MITQDKYHVVTQKKRGQKIKVKVPGSKSITNRALLLAALAEGTSLVKGILFSDDSRHFLKCLKELGFTVEVDEGRCSAKVIGLGGQLPSLKARIHVGSAGTAARFLTAMLGLSEGEFYVDASEQMKKRPMDALLNALVDLGAHVEYLQEKEHLPIIIGNEGLVCHEATVDIDKSSQFLSALLIAACKSDQDFRIHMTGSHGMAYIDLTIKMMEQFGGKVMKKDGEWVVPGAMKYHAMEYQVEPDVSAACYFYAMAPLLGATVQVEDVHLDCLQGDIAFVKLLAQMGCEVREDQAGVIVSGPAEGRFPGVDVDMGSFSDQTMTLAALAPFASGPTTIHGISHIKYQESNRIQSVLNELGRMGIRCEELEDGIRIYPGVPKGCEIQTYEDHRMAMAFSLVGLRCQGVVISDPACCKKTFENYFQVLEQALEQPLS